MNRLTSAERAAGHRIASGILEALFFLPLIAIAAVTGAVEHPSDRAKRYDEHMRKVSWWRHGKSERFEGGVY